MSILGSLAGSLISNILPSIFGGDDDKKAETTATLELTKAVKGLLAPKRPSLLREAAGRPPTTKGKGLFQARPGQIAGAQPALKAVDPTTQSLFWARVYEKAQQTAERTRG